MDIYFKRLRKQLPHRYAAMITERLEGFTVRQVRAVFNGEITHPDTVEKVIRTAIKVRNENQSRNRQIIRRIGKRKNYRRAA